MLFFTLYKSFSAKCDVKPEMLLSVSLTERIEGPSNRATEQNWTILDILSSTCIWYVTKPNASAKR
jgi:hypothetical protein